MKKERNEFYGSMVGKNLEALFEHENHNGFMKGFSSNYVRVQDDYEEEKVNRFANIRVDKILDGNCSGIV